MAILEILMGLAMIGFGIYYAVVLARRPPQSKG